MVLAREAEPTLIEPSVAANTANAFNWPISEDPKNNFVFPTPTVLRLSPDEKPDPELFIPTLMEDTYRSIENMVNPHTGWPIDATGTMRQEQTTISNIAGYIITKALAPSVGLCSRTEAVAAVGKALHSLRRAPNYHGLYPNWWNAHTGKPLAIWPQSGAPMAPFVSTVDNGNLALALVTIREMMPEMAERADKMLKNMDFSQMYDPKTGLLKGGIQLLPIDNQRPSLLQIDKDSNNWHYGALFTEAAGAGLVGVNEGKIPPSHLFLLSLHQYMLQQFKQGEVGPDLLTWGGSLFEAGWIQQFLGQSVHPVWKNSAKHLVENQIEVGQNRSGCTFGWSPAFCKYTDAQGGVHQQYGEFGLGEMALYQHGYHTDITPVRNEKIVGPEVTVITPHAILYALSYAPNYVLETLNEIARLTRNFKGPGYPDSISLNGRLIEYPDGQLCWDQVQSFVALYEFATGRLSQALAPAFSALRTHMRTLNPLDQQQVTNALQKDIPLNDQPLLDSWLKTIQLPPDQINGNLSSLYPQIALAASKGSK
jgi:hypothetical protein